jgi:hypothetical protein
VNEPPRSVLEAQVQALLQRVASAATQRCEQLRAEADSQAAEIVRSAWAEARSSVRQAVAQERARLAQGLRQASAHADLLARQREQHRMKELLGKMWAQLPELLAARWRDPARRRAWIDAAFREAGALLGGRPWRLEHGEDWPESEQNELKTLAVAQGARSVEWAGDPSVGAGLRIRSEGVCLAATVPGLLARRDDIESAFLSEYFGSRAQPLSEASPSGTAGSVVSGTGLTTKE